MLCAWHRVVLRALHRFMRPPPFVRSRKVFLPLQPSEQACEKHSEDQAPQPAARLGASA